jgi:hypothetical protein
MNKSIRKRGTRKVRRNKKGGRANLRDSTRKLREHANKGLSRLRSMKLGEKMKGVASQATKKLKSVNWAKHKETMRKGLGRVTSAAKEGVAKAKTGFKNLRSNMGKSSEDKESESAEPEKKTEAPQPESSSSSPSSQPIVQPSVEQPSAAQQSTPIAPDHPAVNNLNQTYVSGQQAMVQQHAQNVQQFGQTVAMSALQLHRKKQCCEVCGNKGNANIPAGQQLECGKACC